MKTKLIYITLGAVIASFGYFIGMLNQLNAEDEVARVKELIVSDSITVGSPDSSHKVVISPSDIFILKFGKQRLDNMLTIISSGEIYLGNADDVKTLQSKKVNDLKGFAERNPYYEEKDLDKIMMGTIMDFNPEHPAILLVSDSDMPMMRMLKPKGKKIVLSIDDKSSIKITDGGLNSKTFTAASK